MFLNICWCYGNIIFRMSILKWWKKRNHLFIRNSIYKANSQNPRKKLIQGDKTDKTKYHARTNYSRAVLFTWLSNGLTKIFLTKCFKLKWSSPFELTYKYRFAKMKSAGLFCIEKYWSDSSRMRKERELLSLMNQ